MDNSVDSKHHNDLLLKVASGDRMAFEELVTAYEQAAFSLALRIIGNRSLAEDAVQEAMFAIWKSAETYRNETHVRSWIMQIVAIKSLEVLRKQHRAARRSNRMPPTEVPEKPVEDR